MSLHNVTTIIIIKKKGKYHLEKFQYMLPTSKIKIRYQRIHDILKKYNPNETDDESELLVACEKKEKT